MSEDNDLFASLEPSREVEDHVLERTLSALEPSPVSLTREWITVIGSRPIANGSLLLAAAALLLLVMAGQFPWGLVTIAERLRPEPRPVALATAR